MVVSITTTRGHYQLILCIGYYEVFSIGKDAGWIGDFYGDPRNEKELDSFCRENGIGDFLEYT